MSLLDLQRAFHAPDISAVRSFIVAGNIDAETRLGIYRNNTISNLCQGLLADYPVVAKLVGKEFFLHAARDFVAATPSRSGDINDYGEGFPDFLAVMPETAALPYLPDVARLELQWKRSFYAADPPRNATIDFALLGNLPAARLADLRFVPHPALRLLSSPFPMLKIWESNQDGENENQAINLDVGGEALLIGRRRNTVVVQALSPSDYSFIETLTDGGALGTAVEKAFAIDDSFDVASALSRHVEQENLIGFILGEES